MMAPSPRTPALLRLAPAIALFVAAVAGGTYALVNHQSSYSVLDGAPRAEFEWPTVATVLDGSWMASFDTYMDQRMPGRDALLTAHAAFTSEVLRDPVVNDVYLRGPDGQLLEKPGDLDVRTTLGQEAQSLARTVGDVPLLWVYAPRKEEVYASSVPAAWPAPYDAAREAILDAWGDAGEVLDTTSLVDARVGAGTAFFRTDHHWTPAVARDAATAAVARLGEMGVRVGSDPRAYEDVVAELPFFGSTGRRVTAGATEPDSFVYPAPAGGFRASMCIEDLCDLATIDQGKLDHPSRYANRYAAFIGGDNGLVTITNDSADARGTAVLLKDSYGNAFATYLAEQVSTLYVIDERHYRGVPLDQLIAHVQPDAVIALHNPLSLLSPSFDAGVWAGASSGGAPGETPVAETQVFGRTIVGEDGLVLQAAPHQAVPSDLAEAARGLATAIDATGAPQFWLYAPRKEEVFADRFPAGTPNPVNDNRPAVLAALGQAHEVTDLTAEVGAKGVRDANFFRTDHHWTAAGAEMAADRIVAEIKAAGVVLGHDDRDWIQREGAFGFFGADAATLPRDVAVAPDVFRWDEPEGGFRAHICESAASCTTPVIDMAYIESLDGGANRFRAFLGRPQDFTHLHNPDPAAGGTVVMLRDSFGGPVAVRLAERVTDLYLIDERKWTGEPLGRVIAGLDPDAVVVLHNHVSLLSQAFDLSVWMNAEK